MRRLSLALSLCASLLAGCQGAPPNRATTVTPGASTPSATQSEAFGPATTRAWPMIRRAAKMLNALAAIANANGTVKPT